MSSTRSPRLGHRRTVATVLGAATLLGSASFTTSTASAAVPDTMTCQTTGAIFAASGADPYPLLRYQITAPGDSSRPPYAINAFTRVGASGWNSFGRVLVGPDSRIYGVKTTGIFAYRYTSSGTWDPNGVLIESSSGILTANSANRNKMAVDGANNLWVIDDGGNLRVYRHDTSSNKWVFRAKAMAGGMSDYNYLVAGDNGVLFLRNSAGHLYRMRYDVPSQRLMVAPFYMPANAGNWDTYVRMFSTGGDIVYGITAAGALHRYVYNERTKTMGAYTVVGSGWGWPHVGAITNSCLLKTSTAVAKPTVTSPSWTPVQAQANGSGVDFAYTTNGGELKYRHQPDEVFNDPTAAWQTPSGQFSGAPALAVQPDGRSRLVALSTVSANMSEYAQTNPIGSTLSAANDLGGTMVGHPVSTTLSTGRQLVMAVAADGTLWSRLQLAANQEGMSSWRKMSDLTNFTDDVALAAYADGTAAVVARTTSGQLFSARYGTNGGLSTGVLSGQAFLPAVSAPFTGRPSITVYNGSRIRVTAGSATSATDPTTVNTILQPVAGAPFGSWTTVGEAGYDIKGSPAAIKAPSTGRLSVLVRTSTGELRQSLETVEGSNEFSTWQTLPDAADPGQPVTVTSETDLTTFTYGAGQSRWGFAFRTPSGEPFAITSGGGGALRAGASTFTVNSLGKPAKR